MPKAPSKEDLLFFGSLPPRIALRQKIAASFRLGEDGATVMQPSWPPPFRPVPVHHDTRDRPDIDVPGVPNRVLLATVWFALRYGWLPPEEEVVTFGGDTNADFSNITTLKLRQGLLRSAKTLAEEHGLSPRDIQHQWNGKWAAKVWSARERRRITLREYDTVRGALVARLAHGGGKRCSRAWCDCQRLVP